MPGEIHCSAPSGLLKEHQDHLLQEVFKFPGSFWRHKNSRASHVLIDLKAPHKGVQHFRLGFPTEDWQQIPLPSWSTLVYRQEEKHRKRAQASTTHTMMIKARRESERAQGRDATAHWYNHLVYNIALFSPFLISHPNTALGTCIHNERCQNKSYHCTWDPLY